VHQLRRGGGLLAGQNGGDDRLVRRRFEEAVLVHPLVVEDLREVAAAGVGQQDDDQVVRIELARDADRGDDREPAGAADQEPGRAGEQPRHQERVPVADRLDLVDDRLVERRRPDVLADALHQIGPAAAAGVDRALRVGADHPYPAAADLLEVLAHAADRAAGADAGDEVRHPAVGVPPDLRPGAGPVRGRVARVGVLVGAPGARGPAGDVAGDGVIGAGVVRADGGRADDDLGAVGAQHRALLLADLVGHREDAPVAAERRDHGQPHAGVAAGRLDDRPAGAQPALPLGRVDHRHRDPVLHRATGVDVFQLPEHRCPGPRPRTAPPPRAGRRIVVGRPQARGGRDGRVQPDQRGVTDQIGHLVDDPAATVVAGTVRDLHRRHPPASGAADSGCVEEGEHAVRVVTVGTDATAIGDADAARRGSPARQPRPVA